MMTISTRMEEGGLVVDITGEIDHSTSRELREQLRTAVAQEPDRIVVNLAGVVYIGSAGVATLVECLQRTQGRRTSLVLVGMQGLIEADFGLWRLDRVFTIMETEEEALAS